MSSFLEQYGKALFILVLIAILIAFAGPLGLKIKNATTDKVSQTEEIGCDEISAAVGKSDDSETGGNARPAEPAEAVDQVYCIYYDDGEMTISQNEIESESGRNVEKQGFYSKPYNCTTEMTTAKFEGAVKPKSCSWWFYNCTKLTEIKNIKNLYTNECVSMYQMFSDCSSLTNLDLSAFDTSKVTDMSEMFTNCSSLTNIDVKGFDTSNVTTMFYMFCGCSSLTSLDLSGFNTLKLTSMNSMFRSCSNLKSIDLSGFNVSKVTNMSLIFYACNNLKSITATQTVKDKILSKNSVPSDVTWIIK